MVVPTTYVFLYFQLLLFRLNQCILSIFIVSEKPLNKIGDNKPVAQEVEKRRLAERNPSKRNRSQAQNWVILPIEMERIRHSVMYARQYSK